jgi:DNA polymerase delta subunit 1
MCLAKDDMPPQEIFESYPKGSYERMLINKYCVQDCALVNKLAHRLDFVTQRMALANVSSVPFEYIIFRGQGIKALSLFARRCKDFGYLIEDKIIAKEVADVGGKIGYEGACVFEPIADFYDVPIVTVDFNSLYPSVLISHDISHETLVTDEQYMNLPEYHYRRITYNETVNKVVTDKIVTNIYATLKENVDEKGNQIAGKYGIVGTILSSLLSERKVAKKKMKQIPEMRQIYNGQQLALKITANSIYGQIGSGVSAIGCIPMAASTTAGGRRLLKLAKEHVEQEFRPITRKMYKALKKGNESKFMRIVKEEIECWEDVEFVNMLREFIVMFYDKYDVKPVVVYGDTDSNFINFKIRDIESGLLIRGRDAREIAITIGTIEEKLLKGRLPHPNNMAYEKVIEPLALMSKKCYLGYKYENDPNKYEELMVSGFPLTRRDKSVLFKKVIGKAVQISLDECNAHSALEFLKKELNNIVNGGYPIDDFITSNLLKAKYKGKKKTTDVGYNESTRLKSVDEMNELIKVLDKHSEDYRSQVEDIIIKYDNENYHKGLYPQGLLGEWKWDDVQQAPAHVMLCQRIKERDPGNCPQMNSRIQYVNIVGKKNSLVAERIETPEFILEKGLKIDFMSYILRQIEKPAHKFFSLISKNIDGIFYDISEQQRKRDEEETENNAAEKGIELFSQYGFIVCSDDED